MPRSDHAAKSRRSLLRDGALLATTSLVRPPAMLLAQSLPRLDVASAGSIRALLEGPLKRATARELGLDLHTHAGGADAVARSLVDGSLVGDVFIPITAEPMQTVIQAGKAKEAYPIASTEMVILYSARVVSHLSSPTQRLDGESGGPSSRSQASSSPMAIPAMIQVAVASSST